MKRLSILVPQYNEDDSVVKPLLDSIAVQQGINLDDVEVVICNDGSDIHLSDELINSYPFDVKYYLMEHKGVSATRNACYDHSTGEYVCWCDADDMWLSAIAFWQIFKEMTIGFDGLICNFLEEGHHPETKEIMYIEHPTNQTFYHSTIWRREYLDKNNLRADESLTIHEDSRNIILFSNCSQNVKYNPIPVYLWRWRDNSVCRRDPKYLLKTMVNMIASSTSLIEEFLKRGMTDKAAQFVVFMIVDGYYLMNCKDWKNTENQEYRDKTLADYKQYYKKYKILYEKVPQQEVLMVSNGVRQRHIAEGQFEFEGILFKDWIELIGQ